MVSMGRADFAAARAGASLTFSSRANDSRTAPRRTWRTMRRDCVREGRTTVSSSGILHCLHPGPSRRFRDARTPNANFRRQPRIGSTLLGMGRASGRAQAGSSPSRGGATVGNSVRRQLRPFVGLGVAAEGRLDEPYGGHPAGTPYVVITADCDQETRIAERVLARHAGLPEMAWEHGWRSRGAEADYRLELTIFPTLPAESE